MKFKVPPVLRELLIMAWYTGVWEPAHDWCIEHGLKVLACHCNEDHSRSFGHMCVLYSMARTGVVYEDEMSDKWHGWEEVR